MDDPIPATCGQCGAPLRKGAARYCRPCSTRLRQAGVLTRGEHVCPPPPQGRCAGVGDFAGACARPVPAGTLCARCESEARRLQPIAVNWAEALPARPPDTRYAHPVTAPAQKTPPVGRAAYGRACPWRYTLVSGEDVA